MSVRLSLKPTLTKVILMLQEEGILRLRCSTVLVVGLRQEPQVLQVGLMIPLAVPELRILSRSHPPLLAARFQPRTACRSIQWDPRTII